MVDDREALAAEWSRISEAWALIAREHRKLAEAWQTLAEARPLTKPSPQAPQLLTDDGDGR